MPVTVRYQPPAVNAALALSAVASAAVQTAGETLLAASEPLVPVDQGELVASGKVTMTGPHTAVVSYSALSKDGYDYAIIQHERLDYHHEHGQAKYLEQPFHSTAETLVGGMATGLRAVL